MRSFSSKFKSLILVIILLTTSFIYSQSNPALAAETAALEKKVSDSKVPLAERKQALEKMARLYELSGNAAAAALTWEKAATLIPNAVDYTFLLNSVRCLAYIGEFDKADATLRTVFNASGPHQQSVRLLGAWIDAFKTGRTDSLSALLANAEFAAYKSGIYYAIRELSNDNAVKADMTNRLLSEFPQSPEAQIVRDGKTVSAQPAALWLLRGGIFAQSSPSTQTPSGNQEAAQNATDTASVSSNGPSMLQTGLFSREDNARMLAERLRNAGFSPIVTRKTINGKEHWAVGVMPGTDYYHTMLLLKDKGFEAFPVY